MSYKWLTGAMCAFGLALAGGCVMNLQPSDKISTQRGLFITTMVRSYILDTLYRYCSLST